MDSRRLLQDLDLGDDDPDLESPRHRHSLIRSLWGLVFQNHFTLHVLSFLVIVILAFGPVYNRAKWQESCITRQSIYCLSPYVDRCRALVRASSSR